MPIFDDMKASNLLPWNWPSAIKESSFFNTDSVNRFQGWLASMVGKFSFTSFSNRRTLKDAYGGNPDVYSITNKGSRTAAQIPWIVEQKIGETWELDTESRLNGVICKANDFQSFHEFVESYCQFLQLTGNSIIAGDKPIGFEVFSQITVLPTQFVEIESGGRENPIAFYELTFGDVLKYMPEDILHIRYFNPLFDESDNPYFGMSPLMPANSTFQTGTNIWEANSAIQKNLGAFGMISSETGGALGPDTIDAMYDSLDKRFKGPKKRAGLWLSGAPVKFTRISMTPQELDFSKTQLMSLRTLCNIFGYESILFNDPEARRNSNRKESQIALYTDVVIPMLLRLEQGLNSFLVPDYETLEGKTLRIRPDLSTVSALKADEEKEARIRQRLATVIINLLKEVGDDKITPESAINTLIFSHGLSEDQAKAVVTGSPF